MDTGETAALTCPFTAIGLADRPAVGGKGASLGELTAAGIRVPPGCVVTTAAYRRALRTVDGDGLLRSGVARLDADDTAAIARTGAQLRQHIEQAPLPAEVAGAIAEEYGRLGRPPVAVRSSATGEDSAEASFAGLQDTYLWVRGEQAVLEHVRRCWASLYSTESIAYRRRLGLPEDGIAMAVVLQRMVDPRAAGVMFSRSPLTGDRSVVAVEGCWGLGSALVGGEVTPDRYVISKVTGEITARTVSAKLRRHRLHPDGEGVLEEDVPEELRERPCLSDEEIRTLTGIAKRVEAHYGCPQDMEWAVTCEPGEDGFHLLQSRPETVWAAREARPAAAPKARAYDHVVALLSGGGR